MASTPGRDGNFFRFGHRLMRGIGSGPRDDGHTSGDDFDGQVDDAQPFIVSECGSLSGGAAGNQKIDARFDLPGDQIAQRSFIDRAVLGERRNQGSTTASELHDAKHSAN